MNERILITGGAGFIGTHLSRMLVAKGCQVTVLDNFLEQIHGNNRRLARDLEDQVELIDGDVRDSEAVWRGLKDADVLVHLAAETGTGQSMYEVERYSSVNLGGTAVLMDALVNRKPKLRQMVVASSRAIYGEGKYKCSEHGDVYPGARDSKKMRAGMFEPSCPHCDLELERALTDESSFVHPNSFYGLTKQFQEDAFLLYGRTLGIGVSALRYQNVYGPGQSLSNPYTGILAIFSTLARSNRPINIFEDGLESRDFVYIDDVVDATVRAIELSNDAVNSINVGSGQYTSVIDVANNVKSYFDSSSELTITGDFREGDIRHNGASLIRAQEVLGFAPRWTFKDGVSRFLAWAESERVPDIGFDKSLAELRAKGLMS